MTPENVVQRQLETYNARDLDGWSATYADDARQFDYPGILLAAGIDAIRVRAKERFQEPNLHARLLKRTVMGNMVFDHEEVTRTFPEGTGSIELIAIYEVVDGAIKTALFVSSTKRLHDQTGG